MFSFMNGAVTHKYHAYLCENDPDYFGATWDTQFTGGGGGGGASYPPTMPTFTGSETWSETDRIAPLNDDGKFGFTLASSFDGKVIAFSGYEADDPDVSGTANGTAHIMTTTDFSSWTEVAREAGGFFNFGGDFDAVAVSGDGSTAAFADHSNDEASSNAGRVWIYRDNGDGTWSQYQEIAGNTNQTWSVALNWDGTRLAVGEKNYTNGGVTGAGRVLYYIDGGTSFSLDQTFTSSDSSATGDSMGQGISMSDDGYVVAISEDDDVSVYKYDDSTSTWSNFSIEQSEYAGKDPSCKVTGDGSLIFVGTTNKDIDIYNNSGTRLKQYTTQYNTDEGDFDINWDGTKIIVPSIFKTKVLTVDHDNSYDIAEETTTLVASQYDVALSGNGQYAYYTPYDSDGITGKSSVRYPITIATFS